MNRALVLLGSNIDKERQLPLAVAALRELGLREVSPAYETAPVGTDHPETFLNAAALLVTDLEAPALRRALRELEARMGRVRDPDDSFAPRLIDLDLVVWNGQVLDPDVADQMHAFVPLAHLAADLVVDGEGRTLAQLAAAVVPSPFPRLRGDVILVA